MYIEDLIHFIRDPNNNIDSSKILPRDKSVIFSMSAQLLKSPPLALTENQASLLITILKNNRSSFESIPNFDFFVDKPIYKYPFRSIELDKKIYLADYEGKTYIRVKLPYDKKINKSFNQLNSDFTFVDKQKYFYLSEKNIYGIVEALKEHDFEIEPKLYNWYVDIKRIRDNPEEFNPLVDIKEDNLILRNTYRSVNEYFDQHKTNKIIPDIFLAKSLGLSLSKKLSEKLDEIELNQTLKDIIQLNDTLFSLNESEKIKTILEKIEQYPILVIMNDERNLHVYLEQWVDSFNDIGIDNSDITVLFRSQHNKKFNEQIKEKHLNNMLGDNTKVVFIKGKVPKLLYKTGFTAKLIITDGIYFAHTSLQKLVEHHCLILYYSDTGLKHLSGRTVAKL